MITLFTILIALGCIMLMTIILIQDPKNGNLASSYTTTKYQSLLNQGKSSQVLEKMTWGIASILLVMCVITTVIS